MQNEDDTFNTLVGSFEFVHKTLFSSIQTEESAENIFRKYGWTREEYHIEYFSRIKNKDPYLTEFNKENGIE